MKYVREIKEALGISEPIFLNKRKDLEKFNIGDWSHGKVNVLTWGREASLTIGKYCSFAETVTLMLGGEHHIDWISTYAFPSFVDAYSNHPDWPRKKGPMVIGNDVWIGRDSVLMSGITVGDGAVIGAGSVVRKNVKPYAIVVGNPAIFAGYRFPPDIIEKLLMIKWWNWPHERIVEALPLMMDTDISKFVNKYYAELPSSSV
jgi:acetyltransferase-like isoleucine patch superfamily enzyme